MPGVWGLGVNMQYMFKHLVYAEIDAGYGWVIGDHSNEPDTYKKWRGWFSAKVGYPVLSFTGSKTGKWVVENTGSKEYFYHIDVPTHFSLIALAGYTSEPMNLKVSAQNYHSFQAPVFTLGVKWLSFLRAKVRANEHSGSVLRKFEAYFGLVIPVKDEILGPEGVVMFQKSEGIGYELMLSIPYRLNGWATFDIGMRSSGYDDKGQIFIGNTFYL
jgi:hypothetical protein